ncbi:binding-protein-dependent transport systems inner membrane component [Syntrophobotulus glycolicus DSM 8271]|uniref:Binding-protein-dependent transport systems inner membrane component n=1 Tax=Syntrophobotulus glycolicus (strain DSM 8271 / FlGlyR) TaxID=645991 RepID=F0SWK1_SYNGF|nr:ABC transporter permease [Syntrophobotulus glycolicus]ADY56841.1 binding-protein-dependent transport systems inner membrane component [Syntrophobotulus glycolicus DSM 8271]
MAYIGRRIVQALISILGIATIVFFSLHLSGDPVLLMVPPDASANDIEVLRHALGLDQPLGVQYIDYLKNLFTGDLGRSYIQSRPVAEIILQRFPYTIQLAACALFLSVAVGIPVGMLSAIYRGKWVEKILMPLILIGQSMPAFWTGILLIMLVSVHWHWLPSSGVGGFKSLIMPSVTLASLSMATLARMTRSSFLEQLGQDYVRTARSKGAGVIRLIGRHILRNAAIPIITLVGMETANLLGGAVITETIFAWPGLGQLMIQAINARDFPLVQAIVLFISVIYIVINLITDLVYVMVDPRIKLGKEASS